MNKLTSSILKIATVQGVLIGIYHIILPYQWNWHRYTADLPPMIEWSLYALNFFFSVLLILLSLVAFNEARGLAKGNKKVPMALLACLVFWIVDGFYQLIFQVPAPASYAIIKPLFLGAAVLNVLLYALTIYRMRKEQVV